MTFQPETLQRLHRIFFPGSVPAPEWYERFAALLEEHATDDVHVIAYFHAMCLHKSGSSNGNPAVTDGARAPLARLKHFGSKVTLVIPTTASERWLEQVMHFYDDIGVTVVFAVDARTSDGARSLLSAKGAACIDLSPERRVDFLPSEIFSRVDTDWVLLVDDDELPTPALLNFVDKAVEHSTDFVWGFPRVHCRYDGGQLQYSQFLPFGPFANTDLQWRLLARQPGPKEQRSARTDAVLLNFDWVARSFVERVDKLRSHVNHDGQAVPSLASLYLHEAIPESWHMFAPLPDDRYRDFAATIHQSRTGRI